MVKGPTVATAFFEWFLRLCVKGGTVDVADMLEYNDNDGLSVFLGTAAAAAGVDVVFSLSNKR